MSAPRTIVLLLLMLLGAGSAASVPPRIAIIIDDLGYRYEDGRRAIELPGPIAYAVLPGAPRAKALADLAHQQGKEVLLHLPLQATPDGDGDEPETMHLDMSRRQFNEAFDAALASVPNAVGVNGHRGSLLTRHPGHMRWLMEEIRARESLFFVDSYTTHESVALQFAAEVGVLAAKRDVFLDPDRDPETVAREFRRLKKMAVERGAAVAIGHPYPATLALLERELPRLADEGFELVSVRKLLRAESVEPIQPSSL